MANPMDGVDFDDEEEDLNDSTSDEESEETKGKESKDLVPSGLLSPTKKISPALLAATGGGRTSRSSASGRKRESLAQSYMRQRSSFQAGGGAAGIGTGQYTLDTVIVDIGSRYSKIGYECEAVPRRIIPTKLLLGDWRASKPLSEAAFSAGARMDPHFLGFSQIQQSAETWQETAAVLVDDLLYHKLLVRPDHRRVLIVSDPFWPESFKHALVKALFDINVPGVQFLDALYAPLFVTGRTSGLVLDVGYCTAKVEGFCFGHRVAGSTRVCDLGFATVIDRFKQLLTEYSRVDFTKYAVKTRDLEACVARTCVVSPRDRTPFLPYKDPATGKYKVLSVRWEFKHGNRLSFCRIPPEARMESFEALFDAYPDRNLACFLCDTLLSVAKDTRIHLVSNVILAGGTAAIKGFKSRFMEEWKNALQMPEYTCLRPLENYLNIVKLKVPPNSVNFSGASVYSDITHAYLESLFQTKDEWQKTGLFQKSPPSCRELIEKHGVESKKLGDGKAGDSRTGGLGVGSGTPHSRGAGRTSRLGKRVSVALTSGVSGGSGVADLRDKSKAIQDRVSQLRAKAQKRATMSAASKSASALERFRPSSSAVSKLGTLHDTNEED